MNSVTTLPTLLVAAMLVLAGCAGTVSDPAAGSTLTTDGGVDVSAVNTITTSGSATVSDAPDLAVVGVTVEIRSETASEARSLVADDVDSLRAALSEAGYEPETVAFRLAPEYDYRGEERELVGYRAVHSLRFETTPESAGSGVDLAVDNGATSVDYVQFTLSDEKRAELRAEALAAAVNDARATAETVADAADRSAGTELSIHVGSAGFQPYDGRVSFESADAAGSTSFEPGPVTVSASVTVTYELE